MTPGDSHHAIQRPQPLTGESTMDQALAGDPNLPVVLMRFHIGGCSLCGFEPQDTVAQVAEDNGVPLEVLLEALNGSRCGTGSGN